MDKLKEKELNSSYFDFYKELLTDKQREYFELHVLLDNSIGEIALDLNVSRNAVHDNVARTIKILANYENKLELYRKSIEREKLLRQIETKDNKVVIDKIRELE